MNIPGLRTGTIKSSWLALADYRMDADFWIGVCDTLKAHGLKDPETASLDQVKLAIVELNARHQNIANMARSKRLQAARLEQEARALEATLPKKMRESRTK